MYNWQRIRNVFDKPRAELCLHELCRGEKTCMNMNVGANGDYWSSSSYLAGSANAGNLGFNSSVVNPLNNNNRANGFPVRCVQHLCGCFLQ